MAKKEFTDDDEERTTAVGLARYAIEYYTAAEAAAGVLMDDGDLADLDAAPPPVMFLVTHSIELVLKSYLRDKGYTLYHLQRIGHDLMKSWKHCKRNGLNEYVDLTDNEQAILKLVSSLHSTHDLRYITTGFKTYPVFGALQNLAESFLDGICKEVGFPYRPRYWSIGPRTS